jgi:hypothetical protein
VQIAIVIRPWKSVIVDYVARQLPNVPIQSVLFDDNLFEWPGSVHSARAHYSDVNIVLLPDSYLALSPLHPCHDANARPILHQVIQSLEKKTVVFGYKSCSATEILKQLGALKIIQDDTDGLLIDLFQDKPAADLHRFNAYWCCYAFVANAGAQLYDFLRRSVSHLPASIQHETFHPAGAFPVYEYFDLGTRSSIQEFLSRSHRHSQTDATVRDVEATD